MNLWFLQASIWLELVIINILLEESSKKLRGLSPQANYTDQATAACRQS
jgi:hypothetical protein